MNKISLSNLALLHNYTFSWPKSKIAAVYSSLSLSANCPSIKPEEDSTLASEPKTVLQKTINFLLSTIPFLNEAANVLSHLKEEGMGWCLEWLYKSSPQTLLEKISKHTIDFFSLLAMGANGISKFHEYLKKGASTFVSSAMGLWETSIYLLFSYIIPSFSIPLIQSFLGSKFKPLNKPLGRFATGVLIGIGSLEIGVKLCGQFITPLIEKITIWFENKFMK
jgi:hypothetical protein